MRKEERIINNTGQIRLVVFFCAGLLLFTSCKYLFHPEGPETDHTVDHTVYYTVTFDANGGRPSIQTRTVQSGSTVGYSNMPSDPTWSWYIFGGWYRLENDSVSQFTYYTGVYDNITVYALWTENEYTVTFNAGGGSPVTQTRTVTNDSSVGSSNMPSDPTRDGYTFGGWYTEQNGNGSRFTYDTTVNGNMTVYAWWTLAVMPDNLSLNDALTWISNNAATGNTYTITLRNNEAIAPRTLSYSGKTVGITLTGGTMERTVSLSATGSLLTVESGVTLTLGNNLTLQGRSNNTAALVQVNSGGTLVMNSGSRVTENTNNAMWSYGGGIYIAYNGAFTMSGGIISNNSADFAGGGIYMTGTFIMSGGIINNNSAKDGGGVRSQGTFTISGGTISNNTGAWGGGVLTDGIFTMSGGVISGNTGQWGGGVYVDSSNFIKQMGGVIYGSNENTSTLRNTATDGNDYGHAVYVTTSPVKKRNTTAGSGVTLNSAVSGSTGGWE
jgi:uncharacterized repeat protein (TIGR02543 family)